MLGSRIWAVIVDDSSGHPKVVEHVLHDELDHVWCLYFF